MATWEVRFPDFVNTSTGQIRNKQVIDSGDRVSVTLYAQVYHTGTSEIAGERAFSYTGAKGHPGVYAEAVRDMTKDVDEWSHRIRSAITIRQGILGDLETDILVGLTT